MTIQAALHEGFKFLAELKIETAMLDSTVLLAEALQVSKEQLFTRLNEELQPGCYSIFRTYLKLREKGQPVSYIRKKKEFFGLEFYVDNRVLVPRPDTELLVETAAAIIRANSGISSVHDLCTGSGCVAIALKTLFPELSISASDISEVSGEVFQINCQKILGRILPYGLSNLFEAITISFDLISANPPYLGVEEYRVMQQSGWPEPESALKGGAGGLELSETLIREAPGYLNSGGYLVLESGFDCMEKLEYIFINTGFIDIEVKQDLGGRDRVISGRWL